MAELGVVLDNQDAVVTTFGESPPSGRFWVAIATAVCKPSGVAHGRSRGRRTEIVIMATVAGGLAAAIAAGGLRVTKLQVSDAATTPGVVVVVTAAGAVRGKVDGWDAQLPRDPVCGSARRCAALATAATASGLGGDSKCHRVR